ENLGGVINVDEVVFLSNPSRPVLNRLCVNLYCTPTIAADKVVMMFSAHAAAKKALTVVRAQNIHFPGFGQCSQRAVDGRQPHGVAGFGEECMQLLGGSEATGIF